MTLQSALSALVAPRAWVLYAFLGSTLWMHFRGRVRHRLLRQVLGHDTLTAPYNVFALLFSKVPRRAVLDVADFPELAVLRDNWEAIRDEALALQQRGAIRRADGRNDLGFDSFFKEGWTRFYLRWYGEPLPSARELCPRTVALLEQAPSVNAAMFTVLPPGGRLRPHRDPFAGSVRYHLGLVTPGSDDCWIRIDDQFRSWRDAEDLVFDETYIHSARNDTDVTRIILFCDVTRPLRGAIPRAINHFMIRHVVKAGASRNAPGERLGILNRAFEKLAVLNTQSIRLKRWNAGVYYALKYAAIVGLVWLILFA